MATDFTQESVLRFILIHGGTVRNADLLSHFRRFLREDEEREQNRELFKKYVNTVATVKYEDGASQVVLRKKYRVHLGDVAKHRELDPKPGASKGRECKPALPIPAPESRAEVLPAAGIITKNNNNNNDFTPSLEEAVRSSSPHGRATPAISINGTCPSRPALPDTDSRSSGSGQSFEPPWEPKVTLEATGREHGRVYPAKQRQLREADGCEQSIVNPTHCAYYEVRASPPPEKPNLNVNTLDVKACKPFKTQSEEPVAKARPLHAPLGQSLISTSTPCLLDVPVAHAQAPLYTQAGLSRSNDSLMRPNGGIKGFPIQSREKFSAATDVSNLQMPPNAPPTYLQLRHPTILTSSYDSLSTPSPSSVLSDTGWPQSFGREEWSSDDALKYQELAGEDGNNVSAFLRRSQEERLLSQLHQPSRNVTPLHRSTGYLDDKDSRASPRSISPETHYGPVARRLNSRLQSRMCRSLGEDLDQPFPEETISARHNRLQLLSSTLSMGNLVSTPSSRGHSSRDLSSPGGSTRSLGTSVHDGSFNSKHSSVPLDPREHEWFVKAASGSWTDIYALFREDPNLLAKRDFISGFTILHWIAKHGDHRVLNTLWYGVEKAGMTLDVDAKTLCGYTPLHLAAIHGHKNLIRLLVQKFKADVRIRDSSGKRPWQYLGKNENRDVFELLGAPQKIISGSPAMLASTRPATTKVNVKRHSSIAAMFKHKSHLRVSSSSEAF